MGCWAFANQHGKLSFAFRYRGKQWKKSTGEDYADADVRRRGKALAIHLAHLITQGRLESEYGTIFEGDPRFAPPAPLPSETDGPFLREWAPKIIAERKPPLYPPEYARTATSHADAWLLPALGHRRLGQITRDDVIALRGQIMRDARKGKGGTRKHAKNVITTLSMLFAEAVERGIVAHNPARGLKWPRGQKPPIDPFSREELETLLAHLRGKDPHAYRFALCLADTGMRPGEATGLTWGDVDLRGGGRIEIRRSKVKGVVGATKTAKSERSLSPLSARLIAALKQARPLRVAAGLPVFTGPTGHPIRQERFQARRWARAIQATGVRPRTIYKLRATFVSLALSAGENQQWLADYTGTSLAMFARHYARFLPTPDHAPLAHIPGGTAAPPAKGAAVTRRKRQQTKGVTDGS